MIQPSPETAWRFIFTEVATLKKHFPFLMTSILFCVCIVGGTGTEDAKLVLLWFAHHIRLLVRMHNLIYYECK